MCSLPPLLQVEKDADTAKELQQPDGSQGFRVQGLGCRVWGLGFTVYGGLKRRSWKNDTCFRAPTSQQAADARVLNFKPCGSYLYYNKEAPPPRPPPPPTSSISRVIRTLIVIEGS